MSLILSAIKLRLKNSHRLWREAGSRQKEPSKKPAASCLLPAQWRGSFSSFPRQRQLGEKLAQTLAVLWTRCPNQIVVSGSANLVEQFWWWCHLIEFLAQAVGHDLVAIAMNHEFGAVNLTDPGSGVEANAREGLKQPEREESFRHVPCRGESRLNNQAGGLDSGCQVRRDASSERFTHDYQLFPGTGALSDPPL